MNDRLCGDPTPAHGCNRIPMANCVWFNSGWREGFERAHVYRPAGAHSIDQTKPAPGSVTGYRCRRAWPPPQQPVVMPGSPPSSMARPFSAPPSPLSLSASHPLRPSHPPSLPSTPQWHRPSSSASAGRRGTLPAAGRPTIEQTRSRPPVLAGWYPPSTSSTVYNPQPGPDIPLALDPNVPPSIPKGYGGYIPGNRDSFGTSPMRALGLSSPQRFNNGSGGCPSPPPSGYTSGIGTHQIHGVSRPVSPFIRLDKH